jgi:hypothetical protein
MIIVAFGAFVVVAVETKFSHCDLVLGAFVGAEKIARNRIFGGWHQKYYIRKKYEISCE